MGSCTITPLVKNANGKEVESKLYKDLLSFTGNRETSNFIYALTKVKDFIQDNSELDLDDNGEVTLESLQKVVNINELLSPDSELLLKKRGIGAVDASNNLIMHTNVPEQVRKAIDFNLKNKDYVAIVRRTDEGCIINVEKKNISNFNEVNQQVFHSTLYNKYRAMLQSVGFDLSFIEGNKDYNGIFDPTNTDKTTEGLSIILKINKGELGEEAFPEEFAHLSIEGLISEPLVQRLLNTIGPDMIEQVLGENYKKYFEKYNGDTYTLKKEVAGKLLKNYLSDRTSSTPLLSRLWNFIKIKLSRLRESDFNKALYEANKIAKELSVGIKSNSLFPLINPENVFNSSTLYSVSSEIDKMQELAEDILRLKSKELKIKTSRSKSGVYEEQDQALIRQLQDEIDAGKYAISIHTFLKSATDTIDKINSDLHILHDTGIEGNDLASITKVATSLRDIQNFKQAYSSIIKQLVTINSLRGLEGLNISEKDAITIQNAAIKLDNLISGTVTPVYNKMKFDLVYNFLKLHWGDDDIKSLDNGMQLSLKMLLSKAPKDIGIVDTFINSMSDSSDVILSLIDKTVKMAQARRDRMLQDFIADIRVANLKLTKAGYNTEFMFEKDKDGKKTGRIISDLDYTKYKEDRSIFLKELEDNKDLTYNEKRFQLEKWEKEHNEEIEVDNITNRTEIRPKKSIYGINNLGKLSSVQLEYYNSMINAKMIFESMFPAKYRDTFRAIQIRNNTIENITNNFTDPKELGRQALQQIKDKFVKRSDDVEFGNINTGTEEVLLDYSGNKPIQSLPVYYTQELEDMERLSTDFTSSMVAYAGVAVNYNEMNKIVDVLELAKELITEDRPVIQTKNGNTLQETITILNKTFRKVYSKEGEGTNISNRINSYYEMVVYGMSKKDETFKIGDTTFAFSKAADALKEYTSALSLGLNAFSGVSNIITGKFNLTMEALSGEYYNLKNLAKGTKNYDVLLPQYLGEINNTSPTNKLALLIDKFDALEDFFDRTKRMEFYKNPLNRIIGNTNIYFLMGAGEHLLHCQNMLAMLDAYKVKDSSGNEISLFDAFEVDKITENGTILGGRLKLKEGVTNLNGETITENELQKIKFKIGKVSQSLNGAFNESDKGAIHRYALGRLVMQFKQWMPATYSKRFKKGQYDAQLEQWREGYYNTMFRFVLETLKDAKRMQFQLGINWNNLSAHEKANMRRAGIELGTFALLSLLIMAIGPVKDKEGNWAARMAIYQLKKLKLEVGAMAPTPGLFQNISTIVQSPAASIKTINNFADILNLTNMFNEVQSGNYKGYSEWEKSVIEAVPLHKPVQKLFDLQDQDYMFAIFNNK